MFYVDAGNDIDRKDISAHIHHTLLIGKVGIADKEYDKGNNTFGK